MISFFRTATSSEAVLREVELYRQQVTKFQLVKEMNDREVQHFREESQRIGKRRAFSIFRGIQKIGSRQCSFLFRGRDRAVKEGYRETQGPD